MVLRLDPAQNAHASHGVKSFVSRACYVLIVFVHLLPTFPSIRAVGEDVGTKVRFGVGTKVGFGVGST